MKISVSKTAIIGPAIKPEQFVAEHVFFYLVNGTLSGYYGDRRYTLNAGEYGIVRKNRLGRMDNAKERQLAEKIIFVFDESFLKSFQEKHTPVITKFKVDEPFLLLNKHTVVANVLQSLNPYFNDLGQMDKAFFDVKREALLLALLEGWPELSGVFFDYGIPGKINLEAFMERNYKFNVSLDRFAYLTGRSLSAFKRDFKAIFNETPNRWLIKKRLQEAHFLIGNKQEKPSDIYLDLGFEALSHFSFAFKKRFGLTPTALAEQRK